METGQARRAELHEGIDAPDSHQQTDGAADRGEQDALGQQLPHETRAPGAEGPADGDLTLAGRRAREQQVRDVGAGDEKDASDRGQQRQQCGTDVTDQVVVQWNDPRRPAVACRIVDRILRPQRRGERIDALPRERRGDARLQSAERALQHIGAPDRLGRKR